MPATIRFGRAARVLFPLEPDVAYLNHGTVGVAPLAVMAERTRLLETIERHPARFMLRELMSLDASTAATASPGPLRLRAAAARVAGFLGCSVDGLAFVDNATSGVVAVLRSIGLGAGDEVVVPDTAYGGVARAARFVAAGCGARVVAVSLLPAALDAAPSPASMVERLCAALTPRTRLAILDHVSSETALVMPLAALAAACRARGVAVLADGAHAPGAVPVEIESLGVDWYAANLHKWAFAPRSCGVLWAAPGRRAGLHPAVVSWGVEGDDWLAEFDWTGTRDPTPWLCAPAGIDFLRETLGEAAMRAHNHALAWRAARRLAERWQRPFATPESMVGCMAAVPLPERLGAADPARARQLRDALDARGVEAPVLVHAGALQVRVSIQVYNDEDDIERLASAVDEVAS